MVFENVSKETFENSKKKKKKVSDYLIKISRNTSLFFLKQIWICFSLYPFINCTLLDSLM